MIRNEISQHSSILERDLDVVVYGKAGYPVVAFSTMSAPCTDFEDYGMIDALADLIDSEQIQLFCLSNVDDISWAANHHDMEWRIAMQEAYFNYLCDEALPLVHATNGSELRPLAIGVDVGATQAAILALRRPDLFQGCVALSGVYDASALMDDYMSDLVYDNSPVHFLTNMPADHPYVELYNERTLVFCCGKGHWEDDSVRTQGIIDDAFRALGVNATCDYWGYDVNHDWYWWQKEMTYHLPTALESVKAELAAEAKAAEEPEVKAEVAEKAEEPAEKAAAEAPVEPVAEAAPKTTTRRRSTSSTSKSTSSTGTASKSTSTRRSSTSKSTAAKSTTAAKAAAEPAAAEPAAEAAPKTTTRKRSTSSTSKSTSSTSKSTSTRRSSTSKTAAAKAAAATETAPAAEPAAAAEAAATAEAEATTTAPKSTSTRRSASSTTKSTSSSSTRKSTSTRSSGTSTRKRSTSSTSAAAKAAAEAPAAEAPAAEEKPAETTDTTPEASETK